MRPRYSADSAWRRWSPSSCFVFGERVRWMALSSRVSAKAVSSLHADGQLGREHAQAGADLAVENFPKLEIAEFTQALSEQSGNQEQSRR